MVPKLKRKKPVKVRHLRWRELVAALLFLSVSTGVYGLEIYRNVWQSKYPDSTSDSIGSEGCQLCHRDASGGNPWNAYGWRVREIFNANGFDINDAIELAESIDSDGDPAMRPSIDEINYNFQPGWTAGANNTIYFSNGTIIENQNPPALPNTTDLDWPVEALTNPIPESIPNGAVAISTVEIANGFAAPLKAVVAPGINGSLFVVEQGGKIKRVDLQTGNKTLFYDVGSSLVDFRVGYDERGLLGLAFHPNYQSNGLFYTYQSEPVRASQNGTVDFPVQNPDHRSMVVAHKAVDPSCNSSISKLGNLMIIDQPQFNHNGGDLVFGPDGFLYISLGDGGARDDEGIGHTGLGNGRNKSNPLGSILRIDPLGSSSNNGQYGIPASNPFIGESAVEETYAFGFRNPYRVSFDLQDGALYAADVGQNQIEEINVVERGGDYGWNRKEGSFFFYNPKNIGASINGFISNQEPPSQPNDLKDPVAEYDHDAGARISITGGYVYRGNRIPDLVGRYVFADYLKQLFYLADNNTVSRFSQGSSTDGFITGFAQDADSELYLVTNDTQDPADVTGKLFKITAFGSSSPAPSGDGESPVCAPIEELCVPIKTTNDKTAVICL